MKKVEDIENRRAGKIKEHDVEEFPVDTEDDKTETEPEEHDSGIAHQEAASVQNDDETDSGFALWLRSISQCLSNKISDDPVVMPAEEEEEDQDLDEDTRCMRYVFNYLAPTGTN